MRSIATAALAIALLVAASPLATSAQPAPTPEPAPVSTPSPTPSSPAAGPLPAPTPSAAASPSPIPTAAASSNPYKYVVNPPPPGPGLPAILEIDLLDSTIHAGQPYSVRVRTSLDVTAINVSAMGSTYGMQQGAPGLYASDGQVPAGIPFFLLNRDYVVTVTALNKDGKTSSVPLTLHLAR